MAFMRARTRAFDNFPRIAVAAIEETHHRHILRDFKVHFEI